MTKYKHTFKGLHVLLNGCCYAAHSALCFRSRNDIWLWYLALKKGHTYRHVRMLLKICSNSLKYVYQFSQFFFVDVITTFSYTVVYPFQCSTFAWNIHLISVLVLLRFCNNFSVHNSVRGEKKIERKLAMNGVN